MNTVYYVAQFEDRAKIDKEAKRIGWKDGDGSLLDEFDVQDYQYVTAKKFNDRNKAEAWLIAAIKAEKTFFGVGDLTEICTIKPANRCDACSCGGERRERSWHVEEIGRLDERHHFDDCFMKG